MQNKELQIYSVYIINSDAISIIYLQEYPDRLQIVHGHSGNPSKGTQPRKGSFGSGHASLLGFRCPVRPKYRLVSDSHIPMTREDIGPLSCIDLHLPKHRPTIDIIITIIKGNFEHTYFVAENIPVCI